MNRLLGHDVANGNSPILCALERGHAELQDARTRVRDAVLCPEAGRRGTQIWIACEWHRQEAQRLHRSDASLPGSIPHLPGHCFGAFATPGGRLTLLLCLRTLRVTVSTFGGPSENAELRPWESRPLTWLRPV